MNKKRITAITIILSLLTGMLCLSGCGGIDEYAINNGTASKPASAPAVPASYAELYEKISNLGYGGYGVYNYNGFEDGLVYETDVMEEAAETTAAAPAPEAPMETYTTTAAASFSEDEASPMAPGDADYSTTNVQVDGVDEGDIIKNDGKYIYMLRSRRLTIIDAANMKELCTVMPDTMNYATPYEMYISGDKLALVTGYDLWYRAYVLGEIKDTSETYAPEEIPQGFRTNIMIFDISDRSAPKLENILSQDGSYVSSRMAGSNIYCVTNEFIYTNLLDKDRPETFVPCVGVDGGEYKPLPVESICLFDECSDVSYSVVTAADINSPSGYTSAKAAFGRSGTIYSDGKVLLIAASLYKNNRTEGKYNGKNAVVNEYSYDTDLMLYNLENGGIELVGKGTIPGSLINQFAIDRYKGSLRFVTTVNSGKEIIYTDGVDSYEYESSQSCALYTTDGNLNIVGSIEDLAQDEQVYSVRFDGDIAYFVTFRQTDPLFCADLSDPTAPKILGKLKIPGFSQYMQKYSDTLLFGFGRDADEDTGIANGIKLSMFDISDPVNMNEKHKLIIDQYYSDALYNHKAILVSPEKGLIAFAADNTYVIYKYDDDNGFSPVCELDSNSGKWKQLMRGLFIGNDFYICTEDEVCRYDMTNAFAPNGTLALSEIPEEDDVVLYDIAIE